MKEREGEKEEKVGWEERKGNVVKNWEIFC